MLTGYKYSNDTFLMDASSSVKQSCEREMRPSVASDTRRSLDLFEDTNEGTLSIRFCRINCSVH